jgi:hypothetical protein
MKLQTLIVWAVIPFAASLAIGCSSDKTLSRSTAEGIIRESIKQKKVALPDVRFAKILNSQTGIPEPNSKPSWMGSEQFNERMTAFNATLDDYKWMESRDWIKEQPCNIPNLHSGGFDGYTWHCFVPNRPEVKFEPGTWAGQGSLIFPMSKLDGIEVTGIQQNEGGNQAQVETELKVIPTEFYAAAEKRPTHALFSEWPRPEEVNRKQQWTLMFAKYDDGWRIVPM